MKVKTSKGFTLAELLIVMAIIVVLAAVAVPTFGRQLETARETGDMELIRNAYTEALSIAVLDYSDGVLDAKRTDVGDNGTAITGDDFKLKATAATTTDQNTTPATLEVQIKMGGAFTQAKSGWQYVNNSVGGRTVDTVTKSDTIVKFLFTPDTVNYGLKLVADDNTTKPILSGGTSFT